MWCSIQCALTSRYVSFCSLYLSQGSFRSSTSTWRSKWFNLLRLTAQKKLHSSQV